MKKTTPVTGEQISAEFLSFDDDGSIVCCGARAAAKRLNHPCQNAIIEHRSRTEPINEEFFLKICSSWHPCHNQNAALVSGEIDAVVTICNHSNCVVY